MATLMTSPDGSRLAIVDLTPTEYRLIQQALQEALQDAQFSNSLADMQALAGLINALDD